MPTTHYEMIQSRLSDVRFVDRVKYYPYENYERTVEKYLNNISSDKIKSVFQVGSVKVPGISDIDLLLVFKNSQRDFLVNYGINHFNQMEQYLLSHRPLLMNTATFEKLNLWFPFFSLKKLCGENIALKHKGRSQQISTILLNSFLITKLPLDFFKCGFANNQFHERTMLCQINSLRHTITLAKEAFGAIPEEWQNFSDEYHNFRNSYLSSKDSENLKSMNLFVPRAFKICLELIKTLSDYLEDSVLLQPVNIDLTFQPVKTVTIYFRKDWSEEDALDTLFSSDSSCFRLSLPSNLAGFILAWSNSNGLIARHIRRHITSYDKIALEPNFDVELKKCIQTVEDHFVFYSKKFKEPLSGYYAYWTPVHKAKSIRMLYKINNKLKLHLHT